MGFVQYKSGCDIHRMWTDGGSGWCLRFLLSAPVNAVVLRRRFHLQSLFSPGTYWQSCCVKSFLLSVWNWDNPVLVSPTGFMAEPSSPKPLETCNSTMLSRGALPNGWERQIFPKACTKQTSLTALHFCAVLTLMQIKGQQWDDEAEYLWSFPSPVMPRVLLSPINSRWNCTWKL